MVNIGMKVSFYKGTPKFPFNIDAVLTRSLCRGPYSHCELVFPSKYGNLSGSSSLMDGGVRLKSIGYSSNDWDFLEIPDNDGTIADRAFKWFKAHEGLKYDIPGNVHFLFGIIPSNPNKWFCSEAVMSALGYPEEAAYRFDPCSCATSLAWHFKTDMEIK